MAASWRLLVGVSLALVTLNIFHIFLVGEQVTFGEHLRSQFTESSVADQSLSRLNATDFGGSQYRAKSSLEIPHHGPFSSRNMAVASHHARKGSTAAAKSLDNTIDSLYWNLSCPLEMSLFSAVHIGGDDYLKRAYQAQKVALPAAAEVDRLWPHHGNRRVYFIGDSLLRQVFISLSCLLPIYKHAVIWFEHRGVRQSHRNAIGRGPHSKFEEARVWLASGDELIFHHGIGGMVELGTEYRSHDEGNLWIESCYRQRPLTAMVVTDGPHHEPFVQREKLQLRPQDVVVLNGSVHGERQLSLHNIADVARCLAEHPIAGHSMKQQQPHLAYLVTSAEHFPTANGQYQAELKNETYHCTQNVTRHDRWTEERRLLDNLLPMIGEEVLKLQYRSGHLHVGGRDCLHWIMPGIPDLLAVSLAKHLARLEQPTTSTIAKVSK